MALQHFDLNRVPASLWKNGGGATRELACWPPGADMEHFDWRVSVATVAASGPFSCFAEVDRVITLLTGDGVHLRQSATGIDHRLDKALQPFAFAGDGGMDCDLLGGTSQDFNLMTRRSATPGQAAVLTPDTGLWWADEDCGWSAVPEAGAASGVLVQVLLEPV